MRIAIAAQDEIEVQATFCEGLEECLTARLNRNGPEADELLAHAREREQSEEDFFRVLVQVAVDRSHPIAIPKGEINSTAIVSQIVAAKPDLLCAYGCSLIKSDLIERYSGRFLNLHLGLSPYYRGSGTNYFPLVNGEPEYIGATFMFLDRGIDTGKIVHQIRARIYAGDTVHSIGNRLIGDAALEYRKLIANIGRIQDLPQPPLPARVRFYQRKDFSLDSLRQMRRLFADGLVERYLSEAPYRAEAVPLVQQPWLIAGEDR